MTATACSVQYCEKPAHARGWCGAHYLRWQKTGDVQAHKPLRASLVVNRVCSVDDCQGRAMSRGLCEPHIRRADGKVAADQPIRPRYESRVCSVDGCGKPISSMSYCDGHYARLRDSGDVRASVPLRTLMPQVGGCSDVDCPDSAFSKGLCRVHYRRVHRIQRPDVYREAHSRRWARKRAKEAGAEWRPFTRVQILDRDGWVCGLCSEGIDRELSWPHLQSASVDHIVPLSRGGAHVESNCQAAHLGCNMRKGSSILESSSEGLKG